MINLAASLLPPLTFDRTQLWDKASTIFSSSWTKWTAAGGVVCLAAYAVSRVRTPAVKIDEQLSQAGENAGEVMTVFKTLSPIRGHWFYVKRWESLKAHLEAHPNVMAPFYEAVLELQITDPNQDWLSPACELISFEKLSKIHNVDAKDLKEHAANLAVALECPPENLETASDTVVGYVKTGATYVGQALHSFSVTFLRAHDFSSEDNQTLVEKHEARYHLNNFYEMIEKPAMLIMTIYTFLQPKTNYSWVPYVGTFCSIIAALSLIKYFNASLEKKKSVLSHGFRNLSEEARQGGLLPKPLNRTDVVSKMINCVTPLNEDSLSILLIGPSGVGKDAAVHAFVHELLNFQADIDVHTANTSSLKEYGGGTGHIYLSRIQILMRDLKGKEHRNIMFLNEIHTLNPKKDQDNAHPSELGQQIKTDIETGKLHVIGATTLKEYKDHIEWDFALNRRFVPIFLEPSETCNEILENYLAEKYPTVTVDKDAITYTLTETNKISPEIVQPAKAKPILTEAARSVIGNYGKEEENFVEQSAKLTKEQRALKRDPTNTTKAEEVAKLASEVKTAKEKLQEKRSLLKAVWDLKHAKIRAQEHLTRLAHRITAQPEKSALEMTTFILVRSLLDKAQKKIETKENELKEKGWRVKVTQTMIQDILERK
jgi:ATP-dependent Clp protease ATP-binding subunit ClpA